MVASGCDLLQGYLILPPSSADDLFAWARGPRDWLAAADVELPDAQPLDVRQAAER